MSWKNFSGGACQTFFSVLQGCSIADIHDAGQLQHFKHAQCVEAASRESDLPKAACGAAMNGGFTARPGRGGAAGEEAAEGAAAPSAEEAPAMTPP